MAVFPCGVFSSIKLAPVGSKDPFGSLNRSLSLFSYIKSVAAIKAIIDLFTFSFVLLLKHVPIRKTDRQKERKRKKERKLGGFEQDT